MVLVKLMSNVRMEHCQNMVCKTEGSGSGHKVCRHGEQFESTLCQNTQYGCCPDGTTARSNSDGTNNYGCPSPQTVTIMLLNVKMIVTVNHV